MIGVDGDDTAAVATTSCMAVIRKILWNQVIQRLVHQDSKLEFNSPSDW